MNSLTYIVQNPDDSTVSQSLIHCLSPAPTPRITPGPIVQGMQQETSPLLTGHPTTKPPRRLAGIISMPVVLSRAQRKFVTGVVLLLCVVVLWTLSNFITSDLLSGGFDKPFL